MSIQAPLRLGQILAGKYRIEEPMTAGGFAVVFRGVRIADHQSVCIKALRLDSTESDPAAVQRFVREAAIAAQLEHPHLVKIHDFGMTRENILYQVMELLEGAPLSDCIYGRPFPLLRTRNILNQTLDALRFAHGQQLMHRDIKPSNVFLCRGAQAPDPASEAHGPQDLVKVLDFGVAKGLRHAEDAMRVTLTAADARVGTPGYVAPEMIRPGARVTQLVDLYATGVIGYEMLTGRYAYPGTGWARFAAMVDGDPPPPSGLLAVHPLFAVIQRLMARHPAQRYGTADAALADLDTLPVSDAALWEDPL